MKSLLSVALVLLLAGGALAADAAQPEEGFVSLFDGKTLNGWKVGGNPEAFKVADGMLVMDCPAQGGSAHLFYDGEVAQHSFKNFDIKMEVQSFPGTNSGLYFHTTYQDGGYPKFGMESQINISDPSDWRRTGSLYNVKNLTWGPDAPKKEGIIVLPEAPVADNVWFSQEVIYQNGQVVVKLNDKTVIDFTLPDADTEYKLPSGKTWLPRGTFALQGHKPIQDHISKAYFKNIRVKVLPD